MAYKSIHCRRLAGISGFTVFLKKIQRPRIPLMASGKPVLFTGHRVALPSPGPSSAKPASSSKASPASSPKATATGKPAAGTTWRHEHHEGNKCGAHRDSPDRYARVCDVDIERFHCLLHVFPDAKCGAVHQPVPHMERSSGAYFWIMAMSERKWAKASHSSFSLK